MEYLLQQLITGLTLDSIHVLIPIGYTAVHGTIGMIDLAQGGIFMVGSFIALATFHALAALGLSASPSILFITLLACDPVHLRPGMGGGATGLRAVVRTNPKKLLIASNPMGI
jgi:branched-subunit amino acid ABC-type transport system permease component